MSKDKPPVRRRLAERETSSNYAISRTISDTAKTQEQISERQKERKRNLRHRRFNSFLLACVIASLAVVVLLSQLFFDFVYISFQENTDKVTKSPDFSKISDLTKEYLGSHPLQRVVFLLDQAGLQQYIQTALPEIDEVKLQKANLFSSSLAISLRHPVAKYGNNFVDAKGVVFGNNYYDEPIISIIDNSGVASEGLSSRFLSFVGQVVTELDMRSASVESVVVPSGSVRYVEFRLSGVKYPFKAQIDRNPISQAADIVNMRDYLSEKGLSPSYADVRVESKGYYR
jgi:hypothetical protein